MTKLDPNFRDLLNCFNSAGVRYLVVGGYAVNYHGHHRNTADFDVWLAVDGDNPEKVSQALQAFGFDAASVPAGRFAVRGPVHVFGRKPWRVDLLTQPDGVEFDACYARRVEAVIDGVPVTWIALVDLITNKRASGRTKDLADLDELKRLVKPASGTRAKGTRRPRPKRPK